MIRETVFDKTDKGREEIATRKYQLAHRLRTLLVLVDGKQSGADLLNKVGGLGLNEESLTDLLTDGFIRALPIDAPVVSVSAPNPVTAPSSVAPATELAPVVNDAPAIIRLSDGRTQFEAIYHFYNQTIKSTIGLRGYGLQLKVEKAASINDFRALRDQYLEAVLKAKGHEVAKSLVAQLDQLLRLDETMAAPSNNLPA